MILRIDDVLMSAGGRNTNSAQMGQYAGMDWL
jgi:hypothetical protein